MQRLILSALAAFLAVGCGRSASTSSPTTTQATAVGKDDGKTTSGGFDPLSPIQKARAAAHTVESSNNLKQIAIAFHAYHDAFQHLPANIQSKSGQPLLSWRVALLPFVEEQPLLEQFKLDEPWDSPANKKLLERMPKLYVDPRLQDRNQKPTVTHYRGFGGAGGVVGASKPLTLGAIGNQNGMTNTLLVVEAADPVPWTKPDDLVHDLKQPLPKLADVGGFFLAAFCDGSVRRIPSTTPEKTIRSMIQYDNKEPFKLP